MKPRIYLDNNATTQVDPRVIEAISQNLINHFGNPSSIHSFGQDARNQIVNARRYIANSLNVKSHEVIFTSGGTEGINMLIKGILSEQNVGHIITSNVEHACVFHSIKSLEKKGWSATYLAANLWGAVKPEDVLKAIRPDTRLIALMSVNNETGVKTDVEQIAAIAHEHRISFVVDGVAQLGKESFPISTGISAMCFSGHKIHAAKGIGFVIIRQGVKVNPLLIGGHQEHDKRAGSENASGIAGLVKAIEVLNMEGAYHNSVIENLRNRLETGICQEIPNTFVNGQGPRVNNLSNIAFADVDGEALLMSLDLEGIAVSLGSACSSGALEPSRILINMGVPLSLARASLRFSLSRFTTQEEIDRTVGILTKVVQRLRKSSFEMDTSR